MFVQLCLYQINIDCCRDVITIAAIIIIILNSGREHNFDKMKSNTRGLKYDYGSVMHYSATAFSRNGKPTITILKKGVTIGQRRGLSSTDWMHVKKNYCQKSG